MSRYFTEYDGDDWALAYGRWKKNTKACIESRRGQRILAEIEEMLLSLPEKKLIAGAVCRMETAITPTFCLVGAYAHHKGVPVRDMLVEEQHGGYSGGMTAELGESVGMTYTMGWMLAEMNDIDWKYLSDEQRWLHALDWVREHRRRGEASD